MSGSPDGVYERGIIDPGVPVANSTASFWLSTPSRIHQIRSRWVDAADIVIIGGGMTGMSIARSLYSKNPELSIVIVEARDICSGATGRNGGHVKVMSYNCWVDRKVRFGIEEAIRWTEFEHSHLDEMTNCVRDNNVQCDFTLQEGVDAYFDPKTFRRAIHALQDMRQHAPELANQYTIYSAEDAISKYRCADTCIGAIGVPAASVWPYKLVTSLLESMIIEHGLLIQTNTRVRSVTDVNGDTFASVVTDRGLIRANHVIHATNGWIGHLNPELRPYISPVRGNVLRQLPSMPPLQLGNTFWLRYGEKDYDYMIQRPAGDVIIGRANLGRKATGDDSELDIAPHAHLEGAVTAALKWDNDMTVTHGWSGILGFTQDGNPLVGRIPGHDKSRQWVCGGYHGVGMVKAFRTAQVLAMLVVGEVIPASFPQTMLITDTRLIALEASLKQGPKL